MPDKEALLHLSLAQKTLSDTYKLTEKSQTLDLIANQDSYATGSGASYLNADILEIRAIAVNSETTPQYEPLFLSEVNIAEIQALQKNEGQPTKYAVYGKDSDKVLYLDSLPTGYSTDNTSRLHIFYWQKLFMFMDTSTNNNTTFSDYETSGFNGTFKIPEQYQPLMIDLALANLVPSMYEIYLVKAKQMLGAKPQSVSGKLNYKLGVKTSETSRDSNSV